MRNYIKNLLGETLEEANAKTVEEFAGRISYARIFYEPKSLKFELPPDHTLEEAIDFLNKLDFEYDSDFGGQEVYGMICLNDSTWLSREEYDGSEWWRFNSYPTWENLHDEYGKY